MPLGGRGHGMPRIPSAMDQWYPCVNKCQETKARHICLLNCPNPPSAFHRYNTSPEPRANVVAFLRSEFRIPPSGFTVRGKTRGALLLERAYFSAACKMQHRTHAPATDKTPTNAPWPSYPTAPLKCLHCDPLPCGVPVRPPGRSSQRLATGFPS